jgi:hypothetical protein
MVDSKQCLIEDYNYKQSRRRGTKVLMLCIFVFLIIMIVIMVMRKTYWWVIFYVIGSFFIIELIVYISTNLSYYDMRNKDLIYGTIMDSKDLSKYMNVPKNSEYNRKVQLGYNIAKTKRLLILCLARDVEDNVIMSRNKLENIGKDFLDYKIVLFENDSDDESRVLLKRWMRENNNVELMDCCDMGSCECLLNNAKGYDMGPSSQSRMEKMRYYRETLMRYATEKYYYYDYVMIYDFDISGIVYKDGLMTSFSSGKDWDMVFANGLQSFPKIVNSNLVIYDSLAYIPDSINYDHSLSLIKLDREQMKLKKRKIGSDLVRCKSGFNGIAIYKMECLLNSSYMNSKKYCEHIDLHQDMSNKGYDKIYFNPSMVLFVGQNGPDRSQIFKEFNNFFKKIDNS